VHARRIPQRVASSAFWRRSDALTWYSFGSAFTRCLCST
jgi:hypothetical protein